MVPRFSLNDRVVLVRNTYGLRAISGGTTCGQQVIGGASKALLLGKGESAVLSIFCERLTKWYEFRLQVLGFNASRYVKGLITWWWQDFGITRQADHRWVHCCVLIFGDEKGWESNIEKLYLDSRIEGHIFGTRKDCRVGFTPLGLTANDFICSRAHVTYSIWLEYYTDEQHGITA